VANPRTVVYKEQEAVRRLFLGYNRDEAAKLPSERKQLVATGVVSRVKGEFIGSAVRDGLMAAADAYGVRDLIEGLLDNAKDMRRQNMTVSDARLGIDEHFLMDRAGIPLQRRPEVTKALGVIVKAPNPKKVLNILIELSVNVEENHLSYDDAVPNYLENVKKIRETEERERQKTLEDAQTKEAEIRRVSKEEEARVRRTTQKETAKLAKVRREEEGKTEAARDEKIRLEKCIKSDKKLQGQTKTELQKVRDELRGVKEAMKDILARADMVQSMNEEFSKLGVTKPEEKAAVLREVEQLGEDPKTIAEVLREYKGVRVGLHKAALRTKHERKKFRSIEHSIREYNRSLERTIAKQQKADGNLTSTKIEARKARNHLKYIIRKTAAFEGADSSLSGLRSAIVARQVTLKDLTTKTEVAQGRLDYILAHVAEAEGVEASIAGLKGAEAAVKESLQSKKDELDGIIRTIARAHGAEPTLAGLERRENAFQQSIKNLSTLESQKVLAVEQMTKEVITLQSAKKKLEEFFETVPEALKSIETKAKANEKLELVLGMFGEKLPAGPWRQRFEALAAIGGSFSTYLYSVFEYLNVVDQQKVRNLQQALAQFNVAMGDILRSTR
jgi:hypothetical protein